MIVVACLSAAVHAVAQTDEDSSPRWIADPKTGCKVWDPAPAANETVQWSGPCKNGFAQGKGTLQWLENGKPGDRYDGEYQRGKRNGLGTVTYSNGETIKGQWRDDELIQLPPNEIDFIPRR